MKFPRPTYLSLAFLTTILAALGCGRKSSTSELQAAASGSFLDTCATLMQKTDKQELTEPEKTVAALVKVYRKRAGVEPQKQLDCQTVYSELDAMYLSYENNDPTSGFGFVKRIDLTNSDISDLSPLKSFKNVQELWLSRNRITSIQPLNEFTKLTFLDLSYNKVGILTALGTVKGMRYLDISHNVVKNLDGLDEMTKLQGLNAADNLLQDVDALVDLTAAPLAYLNLDRNSTIAPAAVSKVLKKFAGSLEVVSLEGHAEFTDTSVFASTERLSTLTLRGTSVRDLSFVASVPSLVVLDVSLSGVTDDSVTQLAGSNLEALFASENPSLTGKGLSNDSVQNLKALGLSGTTIADATTIGGIRGLTVVDLLGTSAARSAFDSTYALQVAYLPDVSEESLCPRTPVAVCRLGQRDKSPADRMLATVSYAFLDPFLAANPDQE